MRRESNLNETQHNTDNKSVPIKQDQPDKKTICSRLEQGIPPQLAEVVPAEMEIIVEGTSPDGYTIYCISKALAYGTAEDMIEYIMDNFLIGCPGLDANDAYITKVGARIDGSLLYIIREYLFGGRVEDILDHFGW